MSLPIERVVRDSAERQITMHRVSGGIWVLLGAIFLVVSIFVSGKADEQAARVGAGFAGAALIVTGLAYIRVMSGRVAALVDLLLTRRSELRRPGITALRARGTIIAYEIAVCDASNRKYRMRVPSEAAARQMLANVQP